MRSYVPAYELEVPRNLAETLERMAHEPGQWRPFAGGTDLMVLLDEAFELLRDPLAERIKTPG